MDAVTGNKTVLIDYNTAYTANKGNHRPLLAFVSAVVHVGESMVSAQLALLRKLRFLSLAAEKGADALKRALARLFRSIKWLQLRG